MRLPIVISIFSLVVISVAHEDLYSVKYTTENFSQEVGKKNHFVMFYAPWCGHCQKFAPKWEQLAEMLNEDETNNIKIAKVDCTTDNEVCSEQDITGYPTLKFYKVGDSEGVRFKGTRDLPSITNFINEQLREGDESDAEESTIKEPQAVGGLIELTEDTFNKHVETGKHFIKFYAPWCGHCQKLAPTWEQLAKSLEFEKDITIGKVDCTQYRSICNNFEVKGYPTLLWIENGAKIDKYQGERSHHELKQYVNKMLGTEQHDKQQASEATESQLPSGEITNDDFKSSIQSGIAFVKFYAPWCGHCKRLSPTWDNLREKFVNNPSVKILKIDCTLDVNKQLCNDEEVEGFPSLFLYKDGEKMSEYTGSRSLDDLHDYIMKNNRHDEL
ncbi:thioredoxin domain-containing protein 5 homolog [Diorhabda carinulata]|uniref:thioredoxin domain-containing protein 5 homolog n=1 Tax=Diorhabda sublineata TaxID=1163346 RepID=UPI0024E17E8D|nr:thioredoxin domain-containing protein 5 homolog [Diorhabda sublineata]XP_057665588.1 thioredoxin domain-containing protein 5 homolog [Diorhabda carinulata]